MDAELALFLANENRKRIPVARVGVTGAQLATNSVTDVGIAQIDATQGSSIATVSTVSSHGLIAGEVVTIASNETQATIDSINGNGTIAVVSCATPHALIDGATVTIAGNVVSFTDAAVTGDGSTATVVTSTPHGFADGDTVSLTYTVAGATSQITVGIISISGDGTTATVQTSSPHTFIVGETVYITSTPDAGTISYIQPNTPSSGNSTVYTPNPPAADSTVVIAGNGYNVGLLTQGLYHNLATASGGIATLVTAAQSLPASFTSGASIVVQGLRVSGSLTSITAFGTSFYAYTATDHGLAPGSIVNITGITGSTSQTRFNGTWTVASTPAANVFIVSTTFSSTASFLTSAKWNGNSGFNGSWTISSIGSVSIGSVSYKTVKYSYSGTNVASGDVPTYGTGCTITLSSGYNGTYTVASASTNSFVIAFVPTGDTIPSEGGTWTNTGLVGSQVVTAVDDSTTFEFASTSAGTSTGGFAAGDCGLNVTNATVTFQDVYTFTYPTTADTGGTAIAGFEGSGNSGFNGVQTPITYIDGLTFSYDSGTTAIVSGGSISAASGYNTSPATVLSVPSSTEFTIANNFAGSLGTALPYVYGATSATGTVTTFDTSYHGVTTSQIEWSQPAVFSTNGMVAGSRGITVPKSGWYKIISRATLSASSTSTYESIAVGAYAWIDIYIDGYLQARSIRVNQQESGDYSLIVSDLMFLNMNQTINVYITAFTPVNSGQVYAWGFGSSGLTYLAAVFMSP